MFNLEFGCPICNRLHAIRQCTRFLVMDVEQKLRFVAQKSLCYNCLAQSHGRNGCKSIDRCRRCMQDHNTWLHPIPEGNVWVQMTAYIRIITRPGEKPQFTRALIDPNASRSSITDSEASYLGCKISKGRTTFIVYHSREEGRRIEVDCVVEKTSYGRSPKYDVERYDSGSSEDASRNWHKSLDYFVILGADVQNKIFIGPAIGRPGHIYIQDTAFGYVYFGEAVIKN